MSDLQDLYQEVIIDHSKRPRNFGKLAQGGRKMEGHNPLCGDRLTLYVDVADGVVKDVAWEGAGCAISTASASIMTQALKGKSIDEADQMIEGFQHLVTGRPQPEGAPPLGKLEVFAGVCEYPSRVKCASLAWHTMRSVLHGKSEPVSTE